MKYGRRTALWMAYLMILTVLLGGIRPEEVFAAKKEKVSISNKTVIMENEDEGVVIRISNAKPTSNYVFSVNKKGVIDYSVSSYFDYYDTRKATKAVEYWVQGLKPGKVKVTISKMEGKKTKKLKEVSLTVKKRDDYGSLQTWYEEYLKENGDEYYEEFEDDYDDEDDEDDDDYVSNELLKDFQNENFCSEYGDYIKLTEGSRLYFGSFISTYGSLDPATITVTSDNTDIVKIQNRALVALKEGTANIEVESEGFTFSVECAVIPDPKDSYSKLAAKLERYKNAAVTASNYTEINNALYEYRNTYMEDPADEDRVLVPISYDVKVLENRLKTWMKGKCKAADTTITPQGLKIKKVKVTSSKKVRLTLKSKLTHTDILWLAEVRSVSSFKKYSPRLRADLFVPMVDKNAKKCVILTGKVKAGQKTITLKASKTIKKNTPYYISQTTKKGKKTTLSGLKVVRKK